MITLQTNYGDIKIELDYKNTPKTSENFIKYAKSGFYDGTIFHRVIDGFMVQGGGFESDMSQKAVNEPIENEADKSQSNNIGTIAMARTNDPHSATAQFFINVADNKFLDHKDKSEEGWGYCVFGKTVKGMEVVNKIQKVETCSSKGHQDVPIDSVILQKVVIDEE